MIPCFAGGRAGETLAARDDQSARRAGLRGAGDLGPIAGRDGSLGYLVALVVYQGPGRRVRVARSITSNRRWPFWPSLSGSSKRTKSQRSPDIETQARRAKLGLKASIVARIDARITSASPGLKKCRTVSSRSSRPCISQMRVPASRTRASRKSGWTSITITVRNRCLGRSEGSRRASPFRWTFSRQTAWARAKSGYSTSRSRESSSFPGTAASRREVSRRAVPTVEIVGIRSPTNDAVRGWMSDRGRRAFAVRGGISASNVVSMTSPGPMSSIAQQKSKNNRDLGA